MSKNNDNTEPSELTSEQKKKILDRVNNKALDPPGIKELTSLIWGGEYDGRSKRSMLIKQYLSTLNVKARGAHEYRIKGLVELTDEQKEFIANNCGSMTGVEMARELFEDPKLTNLDQKTRSVIAYLQTVDNKVKYSNIEGLEEGEYKPPKTINAALKKVNQHAFQTFSPDQVEKDSKLKECLQSLIKFCHVRHFLITVNNYTNIEERELFESNFVRYVWDKSDLGAEEVDAYINLCIDIVSYSKMQKELDKLREMRDNYLNETDGKKLSMSMVEAMGKLYGEIDANQKRQNKLRSDLTGIRKDRIDTKIRENASVLQLLEAWRDAKKRQWLLKLQEKRKELMNKELQRLDDMDAFMAEVFGINKGSF